MAQLTDGFELRGRCGQSRVIFGPHETNLSRGRNISERHVAYYERRACGGAGVIVTEVASVHHVDWPYERAPLAAHCGPGWCAVVAACRPRGALVLAGLGHSGNQGSSAFTQAAMWGASRVADVVSRELPVEMEQIEIDELTDGFRAATRAAVAADVDGVELDAGARSLLRQFLSGLTNHRADAYGADKLALLREVLRSVRTELGEDRILALRLSCDELAPWAGIVPDRAAECVAELAKCLDLLVVVRGGPYAAAADRPDGHTPPGFNVELCRKMRAAATGRMCVVLQGSVVDPGAAQAALDDGVADLVEMTRAQIADAELVAKVRAGHAERIRPCILCNQACRVRDNRNPIVSCVADPGSGHETQDPPLEGQATRPRRALVVGGGPAGLECARVLAARGHHVRLAEAGGQLGGVLRAAAVGAGRDRMRLLADWFEAECRRLGVEITTGAAISVNDLDAAAAVGEQVVLATGSRPAMPFGAHAAGDAGDTARGVQVRDALAVFANGVDALPAGRIVVYDPIGGPVGIAVAELLAHAGRVVALVTPDQIAGRLLSLTGDLADANTRLLRAGITRELRSLLRRVGQDSVEIEDVWTGEKREIFCNILVDAGHRLAEESLYLERRGALRAGDAVAPRSILEAVLEGRRRALEVEALDPKLGRATQQCEPSELRS